MFPRDANERRAALKRFIDEREVNVKQWAMKAGVSPTTVYNFLNGHSDDMSTARYEALADAVDVTVDDLLGRRQVKVDLILSVAERLIDEHGYDNVSMKKIAKTATVSENFMFIAFENKKDLLYAIIEKYNDRTFEELRRLAPVYGSIEDRIKYLFRGFYVNDLSHVRLTAAMHAYSWEWSSERERDNQRHLSDYQRSITQMLEAAAQNGDIARGDFTTAADNLFFAYTMVFRHAVFEAATIEQLMDKLTPHIRLALAALKP